MKTSTAKPSSRRKKLSSPEEELAQLKREKAELEARLKAREDENQGIALNEYIQVMSLVPFKLNLSTERMGRGRQFSFTSFGEVKRILYNDLASIIENYRSFMEQGYFCILNHKVIRNHGLDDMYEKVLTKDKIEKVLSFDPHSAVSLYEMASSAQKEVINSMLIEKIKQEEVDMNIIHQISKVGKIDLLKLAEEAKQLEESPE